eukprot:PhF_6_TR14935/c1_g3_i2/m.23376
MILRSFVFVRYLIALIFIQSLIGAGTLSCTDLITEGTGGFQDGPSLCDLLTDKLNTTLCDTVVVHRRSSSSVEPLTFTEPCKLSIPSNVGIRFQCNGVDVVSYVCISLCFTYSFGRSIEIVGCRVQGSLLSAFNVTNSTFTLRDSVLDGGNTQMPLDLVGWQSVLIENVTVMNGKNVKTFGGGGGCVAVRGPTKTITFRNVFVQNCNALRAGGCISITRDDVDKVSVEDTSFRSTNYGGHVILDSIHVRDCKSNAFRAGVMNVQYMTSITMTNSRFYNGSAQISGCIQIQSIASNITLIGNVVSNCRAFLFDIGGMTIAQRVTHYPHNESFITVRDMTISDCYSSRTLGCFEVIATYGVVLIENVKIQRCTANESSACLRLQGNENIAVIRNVTLSDCLAITGAGGGLTLQGTSVVNISQLTVWNSRAFTVGGGVLLNKTWTDTVITDFAVMNSTAASGSCICIFNSSGRTTFWSGKMSCGYSSARRGLRLFRTSPRTAHTFQSDAQETLLSPITELNGFIELFPTRTDTVVFPRRAYRGRSQTTTQVSPSFDNKVTALKSLGIVNSVFSTTFVQSSASVALLLTASTRSCDDIQVHLKDDSQSDNNSELELLKDFVFSNICLGSDCATPFRPDRLTGAILMNSAFIPLLPISIIIYLTTYNNFGSGSILSVLSDAQQPSKVMWWVSYWSEAAMVSAA